jgi:hypothetical protein
MGREAKVTDCAVSPAQGFGCGDVLLVMNWRRCPDDSRAGQRQLQI